MGHAPAGAQNVAFWCAYCCLRELEPAMQVPIILQLALGR